MKSMIHQIEPVYGLEEANAVRDYILSGGWGTDHNYTRQFEDRLAQFLGVKYCCVTTSGTMALMLALMAVGVKQGDEVICPSLTMMASPNAVRMLGARPIFVDVNNRGVMEWREIQASISSRTKAVLYVSLNGRATDVHNILDNLIDRGIPLVEDACQSLGSKHNGQYLGTIGDIGCFSLSPHKIISTGQGGFVVSNSSETISKFRKLRDFGRLKGGSDIHPEFGINGKFTDFQSIIGLEQLKRLVDRLENKKRIYNLYHNLLADKLNFIKLEAGEVPWFIDVYAPNPDALKKFLEFEDVGSRRMYPPCHTQDCYKEDKVLPITTVLSNMGLWLPSSPHLTNEQIDRICQKIKRFMGNKQ
jgi:perosamine synthetase